MKKSQKVNLRSTSINRDQNAAKHGPTAVNVGQGDGDIIADITGLADVIVDIS